MGEARGHCKMCPEEFYRGRHGMHFYHPAGFGIVEGRSQGNAGNWGLEGTNGAALWGVWGEDGDAKMTFDDEVFDLSFDVMSTNAGFMNVTVKLGDENLCTEQFNMIGDGAQVHTVRIDR